MHSTRHTSAGNDFSSGTKINDTRPLVKIVNFEERHLDEICVRDSTGEYLALHKKGYLKNNAVRSTWAFTAENRKGKAIAVAGAFEYWPGRAEAWAYLTTQSKLEFLFIHRAVKRFISVFTGRLECVVYTDFVEGNRWAKLLGFQLETEMKHYFSSKRSANLYSKITEGVN